MNKRINKFKCKKVNENRLNRGNAWLLLINWLLNRIIKLMTGTDLNDIEKNSFLNLAKSQVIKFHAWIDLDLNECSP